MKFYSSSVELSTLQTHIKVYRLDCLSKISITTFFQIWIWSIQIDFTLFMNHKIVKSWTGWIERFAFIFIGWINWRYCDGFRWLYWTSTNKLLLLRKHPGNNQNQNVFLIIIFKYLLTTGSVSKQDKTKRLATWTVKQLKKIQRNVNGH